MTSNIVFTDVSTARTPLKLIMINWLILRLQNIIFQILIQLFPSKSKISADKTTKKSQHNYFCAVTVQLAFYILTLITRRTSLNY